jgi:ubiquinone/menaquinone biosynthesis C-methylase UbiE
LLISQFVIGREEEMQLKSMNCFCCPACNGEFELIIKEKVNEDVVQGLLECHQCKKHFSIKNGLPCLNFPEYLGKSDLKQQQNYDQGAREYDQTMRRQMLSLGVWEYFLNETWARRRLIDGLELENDASVLETGAGTGSDFLSIINQIGKGGQLHGTDISSGMLEIAQQKMKLKDIHVELVQANASYLPYRSALFNAVLHVGGLNTFDDKKRAMEEMCRVAKPGSKIVICDEGFAPGKEKTWMGKRILKQDTKGIFSVKPPVELIPTNTEDLKVYWIWHYAFWVIEFRKSAK